MEEKRLVRPLVGIRVEDCGFRKPKKVQHKRGENQEGTVYNIYQVSRLKESMGVLTNGR